MRHIKILPLLLAIFSSNLLFAQGTNDPNIYWQEHVIKKISSFEQLNFKVSRSNSNNIQNYVSADFFITPDDIVSRQGQTYIRIFQDTMKIIDNHLQAMSYGAILPDSSRLNFRFGYLWGLYDFQLTKYAPFYLEPQSASEFKFNFSKITDTIIDNKQIKILYTIKHTSNIINDDESRTPIYDTMLYFCNSKTDLVEKIVVYNRFKKGIAIIYYDFDILARNRKPNAEKIFNFNNKKYKTFDKYNFNTDILHPGLEKLGMIGDCAQDSILTEKMLNFPMKNSKGKTHFLKDFKDWILIDIWGYGCRPCYNFHNKLKQERDSLGYRILEKEGINIVCLNTQTLNTELLKKHANSFNIEDIAFCSDSKFAKYFNNIDFPKYYLYSPEGKLVFEGYVNPNDYSDLLKAKADYEKQHNLKP